MVTEYELFKKYVYMKNKKMNDDKEVNISQ
jgi:hypothetical protein